MAVLDKVEDAEKVVYSGVVDDGSSVEIVINKTNELNSVFTVTRPDKTWTDMVESVESGHTINEV